MGNKLALAAAKAKRRRKEQAKRRKEFQEKIAKGEVPDAYKSMYPQKEQDDRQPK